MKNIFKKIKKYIGCSYVISSIYHEIRLRVEAKKPEVPVIVFQMGKVGSTTIVTAVHNYLPKAPVFHLHFLTKHGIEDAKLRLSKIAKRSNANVWCLYESDFVNKYLLNRKSGEKLKIVTLFREPVSRNISSFFYNIRKYSENFDSYSLDDDHWINEVRNDYLNVFNEHDYSLNWFDMELKEKFNIDVYSQEFDKEKGYTIIKSNEVDVLILKLEFLRESSLQAFREFFSIENMCLTSENTSGGQSYIAFYKKYLDCVELPEDYIEQMYGSKYMNHFYSQDEISKLRSRWVNRSCNDK